MIFKSHHNLYLVFGFSWKIRIGNTNLTSDSEVQILDILFTHVHPQYAAAVAYYDVAILETHNLTLSRNVRPVCLPKLPSEDVHQYDNNFVHLIVFFSG